MIKILELFAGIGACSKALTNLGVEHEIVDAVEIDKYAVKSFNAIHNTNFEPQDITKWSKGICCDLIMHGSPCQDFSVAGKHAGGDKGSGTRSSLMYETLRIVHKLRPRYVIWENVKNILSKKHRHNFDAYLQTMKEMGYTNYYQVLNAKDYGVPQNRERVFTVSILGGGDFEFPEKELLTTKLKDVLDDKVDEKYYLSDEQVKKIKFNSFTQEKSRIQEGDTCGALRARDYKGAPCVKEGPNTIRADCRGSLDRHQLDLVQVGQLPGYKSTGRVFSPDGCSPTLDTMQGGNRQPKVLIKNATKQGYLEASEGDSVNLEQPNSKTRRGRVGFKVAQTLTTGCKQGVVIPPLRIRRLTPKECWRLMGFNDEDFDKAQKVCSNTQLYKQAGNSIVVTVLEKILMNLLKYQNEEL